MRLAQLQDRLHYHFGDRSLLLQALTHTSYGYEHLAKLPIALRNNERLEFLGDAILDVILSDILLETFPEANEGQLSKMRAAVVNERTLAEMASKIGVQHCIRLGRGEIQTKGHLKPSILSSTLEALIAAVYLDGGFNSVYPVVRHLFQPFFVLEQEKLTIYYDHKTQFQEIAQAKWRVTPQYRVTGSHGPDHAKTFEVEVSLKEEIIASASGSSKKEAEQNAARAAISSISL